MAGNLRCGLRLSKQSSNEKMDALKVSLERKKECKANALRIVDLLLDNTLTADELLVKCSEINRLYYRDVVEERAIAQLCGYPACSNNLKKNTSSQVYHISTRFNKVFDITERKRFCSNLCFKASQFLENQLPTCPLWLLDEEPPQELRLYQPQEISLGLGNEVVLEDPSVKEELIKSKLEFENSTVELSEKLDKITTEESAEASGKVTRLVNEKKSPRKPDSIGRVKPVKMPLSRLEVIEQSVRQWITLDTLQFLLGPERYRNALASNGLDVHELENSAEGLDSCEKGAVNEKYMELCRKLDLEAIADHALDSKLVQVEQEESAKKELPSYECLSKMTKKFSLNVQAFYQGRMELSKEGADLDDSVALPKQSTVAEPLESNSGQQEQAFSYPLIDNVAQRALRRRIVLEKLNRVSHVVLKTWELSPRDFSTELKQLVATFNLAIKMSGIQQKLQMESSQRCTSSLLQSFNKQNDYLHHLINSLIHVNNLLLSNKGNS